MATTLKKYILKSKNDFVFYAVRFLGSHMQFAKKGTNLFRLNWVCKKMPKKQRYFFRFVPKMPCKEDAGVLHYL